MERDVGISCLMFLPSADGQSVHLLWVSTVRWPQSASSLCSPTVQSPESAGVGGSSIFSSVTTLDWRGPSRYKQSLSHCDLVFLKYLYNNTDWWWIRKIRFCFVSELCCSAAPSSSAKKIFPMELECRVLSPPSYIALLRIFTFNNAKSNLLLWWLVGASNITEFSMITNQTNWPDQPRAEVYIALCRSVPVCSPLWSLSLSLSVMCSRSISEL